jgi:hydrogenase large subunit
MATTHYLEALDLQKEVVKIHTIFGGKNPHPNWLVGGVPCPINVHSTGAVGAINMVTLNQVASIIQLCQDFVRNVYIPDVVAIGEFYGQWLYGGGLSSQAVMAYGDIPDRANVWDAGNMLMPRGAIINGNLNEVHDVDVRDPEQIQEHVDHSWYEYGAGVKGLHPWDGVTEPKFALGPNTVGTKTDIKALDEAHKYSWIKAPRWRGHAMEVGPLSRYIIGYVQGIEAIKEPVDKLLHDLHLPMSALFSTLGRTAARALEAQYCADLQLYFFNKLVTNIKNGDESTANVAKWDPASWPRKARGVGYTEAPRGALGHWIVIENGKIDNYQAVVPTTWNGSPRDAQGNIGAFEASLLNTPMERPDEPVEILRTLHSFDPCLACSTHVISPDGAELTRVKVR